MDDICLQFGKKLKKLRKERGLSQEKLAEITGLHRTYISDIERGARSISLKNIEIIAQALEVKIYELFEFEE
jgi:transcriptional regulator with XRE-family HTH domain